MAAITSGTNGKQPVTEPAGLLAKGYVHVGAAADSDWTRGRNRDTTSSDPSPVRRSIEAVTEGLEGQISRPSPRLPWSQLTRCAHRPPPLPRTQKAVDADAAVDAQNASTAAWKSR
jgi:hypothetical protein